jgi:hypothetical protein
LNVTTLTNTYSDKGLKKDLDSGTEKAHIHANMQVSKTSVAIDSFASSPEVEHYNNYSKNGVIADTFSARLCLDSIPETCWAHGVWRTNSLSPNWNQIPHRGMTDLSQDEIRSLMRGLVERFYSTNCERERHRIQDQAKTLELWYISHGSPDISVRKAVFEDALRTIRRHMGGQREETVITIPKTLVDFLSERDGITNGTKGMVQGRPYPMIGGGTVIAESPVGVACGIQFAVNRGEIGMTIVAGGGSPSVGLGMTPLEQQLSDNILAYWFRGVGGA